jgi:hypothetical protein
LYTILEESIGEDNPASRGGGSTNFPIYRGCNMVTPTETIATTSPLEGPPMPLTIPMVLLWTAVLPPDTRFHPKHNDGASSPASE